MSDNNAQFLIDLLRNTGLGSYRKGDLLYATGPNTLKKLAAAEGTMLLHGGATPAWSAVSLTDDVTGVLPPEHGGSDVVNVKAFGALGDGATDDTAAIQAAIDSLSATGGSIYVPPGDYLVTTLKQNGGSGSKSNVMIYGAGPASRIRQMGGARAGDVPTGDGTQSPNVIEAKAGSGFRLRDLRVIGNRSSGGVKPTSSGTWVGSTSYTYDAGTPTYRQTRADGTTVGSGADLTTDKVWRLLVSHTSDATDIDVDVALGRWALVTDFAALNGYYYDESFNRGSVIYYGGASGSGEVTDVAIEHCVIEEGYYANVLCGSGPAKTGIVGDGCRRGRVNNCYISESSAGIGGLLRHEFEIVGNTIRQTTGNLINCDQGGSANVIAGNVLVGDTTLGARNGVSSYKSDHITVTGNYISNCHNAGVNFQDGASASNLGGVVSGNTIVDCGQIGTPDAATGIVVGGSDHVAVTGNHVRHSYNNGIKVSGSAGVAVNGNVVFECGAYGIDFEDCTFVNCSGNIARNSGRDNFYFEGCRNGTITGNVGVDGNTNNSLTLYSGFRIGPFGATNSVNLTVLGNYAADTRSPKRQYYGLNIEAGTSGCSVTGNDFTANKITPGQINSGTNNGFAFNDVGSSGRYNIESDFRPSSDGTIDLGAATLRWKSIYASKLGYNELIATPPAVTDTSFVFAGTDGELKLLTSGDVLKFLSGHPSASAANLANASHAINTANKYANKLCWDTTNTRMLRASGVLATDPWISLDASISITPGATPGNVQTAAGSGTVNNFALTAHTRYLDITPTADVTYTGFSAGYDGQRVVVTNRDASFLLTIAANNGGSSAANQVRTGADITLTQDMPLTIEYSAGLAKWVGLP